MCHYSYLYFYLPTLPCFLAFSFTTCSFEGGWYICSFFFICSFFLFLLPPVLSRGDDTSVHFFYLFIFFFYHLFFRGGMIHLFIRWGMIHIHRNSRLLNSEFPALSWTSRTILFYFLLLLLLLLLQRGHARAQWVREGWGSAGCRKLVGSDARQTGVVFAWSWSWQPCRVWGWRWPWHRPESKETYYSVKRDLLQCQIIPVTDGRDIVQFDMLATEVDKHVDCGWSRFLGGVQSHDDGTCLTRREISRNTSGYFLRV